MLGHGDSDSRRFVALISGKMTCVHADEDSCIIIFLGSFVYSLMVLDVKFSG